MLAPKLLNFRRMASEEWARLNMRTAKQGNDLQKIMRDSFRESLASYFAPVRMLIWLSKQVNESHS
jgi:hypothetical protein